MRPLFALLLLVLAPVLSAAGSDPAVSRPMIPATPSVEEVSIPAPDVAELDEISVFGRTQEVGEVPGSAQLVTESDLQENRYGDVLRILRRVPGVYIQEEDGFGLRPNIGLRGSGQDRSARITLMEDGVLIAPAPYAASSAYYFPNVRRMRGMEIVKGPATISTGPRTTGGALNLLSSTIPAEVSGGAELIGGSHGFGDLLVRHGGREGRFGYLFETLQQTASGFKDLDGGGDTGFSNQDYLLRMSYSDASGPAFHHRVELKLQHSDHSSDETYLGLTAADFAVTPYRRYAGSQADRMENDHDQISLTYTFRPSQLWELTATYYRNEFARDWFKLQSVNGVGLGSVLDDPTTYATEYGWIAGGDSPADAFNVRHNNRSYYSQGVQFLGAAQHVGERVMHEFEFGVRLHADEEDRFQWADLFQMSGGDLMLTTAGTPGTQTNRVSDAEALAVHFRDVITIGDLQLTPGMRYEDIELRRIDFDTADPARITGPTNVRVTREHVLVFGLGATYQLDQHWTLFGGMHEGFNPPGPGSTSGAEESVNSEFGVRYRSADWFGEAVLFHSDYANLVGTCTASTGGSCVIGDQFDAGRARVQGLELSAERRFMLPGEMSLALPFEFNYTYTDTKFEEAFASGFGPWGNVAVGDEFPYVPEHSLQVRAGLEAADWSVGLSATLNDGVRTAAGQGPLVAGQRTDTALLWDLSARYSLTADSELFFAIENLTDQTYLAATRPAGSRPGLPRTFRLGFSIAW